MGGSGFFERRISQGIPDQRPGFFLGILLTVFFLGSILSWVYAVQVGTPEARVVVTIVLAVSALSLLLNLFLIFRVGYNGFSMNFFVNYLLAILFSVAGMFLFGVAIPMGASGGGNFIWKLVLYLVAAALLNGLPTLAVSGVMWLLMAMFGNI